jgi:predicted transcriptional regulator
MNSLVPQTPAEAISISPEGLEIANCYLTTQDIQKTADSLGVPTDIVSQYLAKREIKAYIDSIFLDYGFNNRFRIRNIMDGIINKKLEEMEEADIGSSKDISELLALSHKMTMEILDRQIKLEEVKQKNIIKNQTNIQFNESGGGSNYQALLDKLTNKNK